MTNTNPFWIDYATLKARDNIDIGWAHVYAYRYWRARHGGQSLQMEDSEEAFADDCAAREQAEYDCE